MAQVWSEPLSYTFTVLSPWWFTWWAWCLWVGLGAGLLYWFYRFQLGRRLAEAEAYRLRELDQVKNHLYTNITHEFRTPLTIINGVAGQLQSQASESVKRGLKMISRNGRQLLRLVNQMLDLAKLESGSLPVRLVQGDIIIYLRYLAESFHSYAQSRNIDLHFQTGLEAYVVDYDREKMLHIVSNLLSNAVKFTPANGKVYFRVAEIIQDNTAFLQIQVKDSGIGIAAEKLPHIFDRFYQVDTSATRSGELARMNIRSDGGTGIGLALTRELVHLLGGTIEVQSRLGEGSTFTVLLPAVRSTSTHAAANGFEQFLPEMQAFSGKGVDSFPELATSDQQNNSERPLLLIIEDNADVVRFLASCLESSYQLAAAPDGQAGIEKALELTPDIIISDVMMPLKDGFEVCDTLKNDVRTSHIPIVLLTAKADVESRITGLRRGADAYLAKPFDEEELRVRLEQLIALRRRLLERYQHAAAVLERTGAEPSDDPSFELEEDFLQQVRDLIQENLADPTFGNEDLCKALAMSRTQLFRKLKALTGMSVVTFIRFYRLNKARQLLLTTDLNISEVAYRVGFNDPSYFGRVFRREFGITPMECRDKRQLT
jgi:signal transduction histidine kinase/CheY-like chemotaxis protein